MNLLYDIEIKKSIPETVACQMIVLLPTTTRDPDEICRYPSQPDSPCCHYPGFSCLLPPFSPLQSLSLRPPRKSHLINTICFQGSSPLLLFHLCLGYHSNHSQSSVILSLYISALSHDWLPAFTLIIAGGNTQKVAASCFLLQSHQTATVVLILPPPRKHTQCAPFKAEGEKGWRGGPKPLELAEPCRSRSQILLFLWRDALRVTGSLSF